MEAEEALGPHRLLMGRGGGAVERCPGSERGMEERGPKQAALLSGARILAEAGEGTGARTPGDDVIPGPDEKGGGFRNAPAQGSVPLRPADRRRSLGEDGDFLVTVRATPGGVARAKVTGRWAQPDGRVSRLPVRRARGRAQCPLDALTLTRGGQAGRATSLAAAAPTCCAERALSIPGGTRTGHSLSGGRSLPEIALLVEPPVQFLIAGRRGARVPSPGGLRTGVVPSQWVPRGSSEQGARDRGPRVERFQRPLGWDLGQ